MALRGHRPTRTCVGCRRRFDDGSLVRFVIVDGRLVESPASNGRGAWLCRRSSCVDSALGRGTLRRALRVPQNSSRDWSAADIAFSVSSLGVTANGNATKVMKG